MQELCGSLLPKESGTIVYVTGIEKDNIYSSDLRIEPDIENDDIDMQEEQISLKYITEALRYKVGWKYSDKLIDKDNKFEVYVNSSKVEAVDIFLKSEELPEELRTCKPFAFYEISLKDFAENNRVKVEKLYKKYGGLFDNKEIFLQQVITLKLYVLSSDFKIPSVQKLYSKKKKYVMPSPSHSGIYPKRNGVYSEKPDKMLDDKNHPSNNYLRGVIEFSPIFDSWFFIQINKNKCTIKESLASIIRNKIMDDNNLIGRTVQARIRNALSGKFNFDNSSLMSKDKKYIPKEIQENIKKIRKKIKNYLKDIDINLINESVLLNLKINLEKISSRNLENMTEEEINKTLKEMKDNTNAFDKIFKKATYDFIFDYMAFEKRMNDINERKIIQLYCEEYNCLNGKLLEPKNEAEMYGLLILAMYLKPEKFELRLLDYDYHEGLDNIAEISEDMFEYLQMENRFNGVIQDITDINKVINNNLDIKDILGDKKYCYVELKMELPEKMNHSLQFVSHIMCWKRNKLKTMKCKYVNYEIDYNKDLVLFNGYPRAKIIYVKELLENIFECKFEN